jgi:hypothetical protein
MGLGSAVRAWPWSECPPVPAQRFFFLLAVVFVFEVGRFVFENCGSKFAAGVCFEIDEC